MSVSQNFKFFLNRRFLTILLLGFSSGLPFALIGSTLQARYTLANIHIVAIGFLGLIGQPYLYKFIWAPFLDRFVPPILGRRRGWMLITQCALLLSIVSMAFVEPGVHPIALSFLALWVAFLSATQDISIDAYRTDLLKPDERGIGAAFGVSGYRLAMLVSGGLALILAAHCGWRFTYLFMGGLMFIGIMGSLLAPDNEQKLMPPTTLRDAVIEPFREILSRRFALAILLFILLYKVGYEFSVVLTPIFLLRYLEFTLIDVGSINKGLGVVALLIGSFLGGGLLIRLGLYRALLWFGFLQASTNLVYMWLAYLGKNYSIMVAAVVSENLCAGMEATAFVAFLMSQCDERYTATQFALFSAFAVGTRAIVGPMAGMMVHQIGWANFYLWGFLLGLPALVVLWFLRNEIALRYQAPRLGALRI